MATLHQYGKNTRACFFPLSSFFPPFRVKLAGGLLVWPQECHAQFPHLQLSRIWHKDMHRLGNLFEVPNKQTSLHKPMVNYKTGPQ